MSRINIEVRARLVASFASTLSLAVRESEAGGYAFGPWLKAATGGNTAAVATEHLKEKTFEGIYWSDRLLGLRLGAVTVVMWALNKASAAVNGGLVQFSPIEDLEGAFGPLVGSATAARERLSDLATFAEKTPDQPAGDCGLLPHPSRCSLTAGSRRVMA